MATNFKSIPIIDISALLAKCDDPKMAEDPGVSEVFRQIDQACREAGFFYVKGHGIPDSLLKEVKSVAHKFFDLLNEEKVKIKISQAAGYRFTSWDDILHLRGLGYQGIRENVTKGIPDMHEAIDYYREVKEGMYGDLGKTLEGINQWPSNPQNFKELMDEYIRLCTDLSRNIMRGISSALTGSPEEFEGERAGDPFWVMSIIGYPGAPTPDGPDPTDEIGCGAHTDYDDEITALQIRNLSGEWISAPPIPGTFVCNIVDMLKIYANGLYGSTLHRVINNSRRFRVCIAYFYETNFDTTVEPLETCIQRTGFARNSERAEYGEHLVKKVLNNFIPELLI